jgi:hypothetical protein
MNTSEGPGHDIERDGFVFLRQFIASSEMPLVAELIRRVASRPVDEVCKRPHNQLLPLRWNDPLVEVLLASTSRIERLSEVSKANDLRWISGYLSTKLPNSPPLWWHQDWWCWDHPVSFERRASQLAVLCYPTATSNWNGALRVLAGTHVCSADIHATLREVEQPSGVISNDHAIFSDHIDQITLGMNAGDAVVIDYRLLHGTHANRSPFRRDCVILNFAPCWELLPANIRAHLVCHPALPGENEHTHHVSGVRSLLPSFVGRRESLPLNRHAPARFCALELSPSDPCIPEQA